MAQIASNFLWNPISVDKFIKYSKALDFWKRFVPRVTGQHDIQEFEKIYCTVLIYGRHFRQTAVNPFFDVSDKKV